VRWARGIRLFDLRVRRRVLSLLWSGLLWRRVLSLLWSGLLWRRVLNVLRSGLLRRRGLNVLRSGLRSGIGAVAGVDGGRVRPDGLLRVHRRSLAGRVVHTVGVRRRGRLRRTVVVGGRVVRVR
jgi:hypothetical protein